MPHIIKKILISIIFFYSSMYPYDINKLYPNPKFSSYMQNIYQDYTEFAPLAFSKEEMNVWLFVAGSTALTYYYDQEIYEYSRDFGNSIGLNEHSQMAQLFCLHPTACLQVPSDMATSLYYLGDGVTYLAMASSLIGYGAINSDNRATSTGYQILEGLTDIAIITQLLKRFTGRETPAEGSVPRGEWVPFVDWVTYQKNVPTYDAYPSGHVAAMSVAFNILNENYPEYSILIKSTYGIALGLLSFEMMHLGVHWASDYPLGIAIGYYFGKVISNRHKPHFAQTYKTNNIDAMIVPIITKNTYGVLLDINF